MSSFLDYTMVGEEKTSLRNRLSKSRENSEEKEDQRSPPKESLETPSNGEAFSLVFLFPAVKFY